MHGHTLIPKVHVAGCSQPEDNTALQKPAGYLAVSETGNLVTQHNRSTCLPKKWRHSWVFAQICLPVHPCHAAFLAAGCAEPGVQHPSNWLLQVAFVLNSISQPICLVCLCSMLPQIMIRLSLQCSSLVGSITCVALSSHPSPVHQACMCTPSLTTGWWLIFQPTMTQHLKISMITSQDWFWVVKDGSIWNQWCGSMVWCLITTS